MPACGTLAPGEVAVEHQSSVPARRAAPRLALYSALLLLAASCWLGLAAVRHGAIAPPQFDLALGPLHLSAPCYPNTWCNDTIRVDLATQEQQLDYEVWLTLWPNTPRASQHRLLHLSIRKSMPRGLPARPQP